MADSEVAQKAQKHDCANGARVLLELRAALSGNAGIPQETRLLFKMLSTIGQVSVAGLLQHPDRVLPRGIYPDMHRPWFASDRIDARVNRLGRIVITLEQKYWDSKLRAYFYTFGMAVWHLLGGRQQLTVFDPTHFKDFIWRRFFSQTLPPLDFELVTGGEFRVAREPWNAMQICALVTRKLGWPSLFPRLNTSDFDLMIAETPYPASISRGSKLVVRYHDAIPLTMPHTISDKRWHHAFHYYSLRNNVAKGAWFACVSDATRKDLIAVFPEVEKRAVTIHNTVSDDYFDEPSINQRIPQIIRTRLNPAVDALIGRQSVNELFSRGSQGNETDYLLVVSTIEPRKNHETLLTAWEKLTSEKFPAVKLVVVGKLGWHHNEIVQKFKPWIEHGAAFFLSAVPSSDLRLLYKHARATICPSLGEGFDFSGVEAMRSGGAVIASDIPVHREIYNDAAEYFNPYSFDDLNRAIQSVIDRNAPEKRDWLVERGREVAARYSIGVILPEWEAFLRTVLA